MPVSTERFIECLAATGIVSSAEAESLAGSLSATERAADADAFARELVRRGKLTRYQAAAIYQGKSDGLLLGNYLILDRLGAGGMGQVFRARHRRMDRVVALKMLSKRSLESPDALARFLREVKTAARLVHPNIVTAYDADEVGGLHFLVMECVDGSDLAGLVKSQGPLSVAQAIDYMSQAAVGLEHAHRQGIVHRDIKPSNLLVDRSGTVKILDMGLARLDDPLAPAGAGPAPDADLTASGSIMGTIDFMAPEQAMDCRQADARADIYSLGCTLHFLLTGRPPFAGNTVMQRLTAYQQAPIPRLAALRSDVPSGLQAVFVRMLAKQPADRFSSMREVIEALKTAQGPAVPIAVQPMPRVVSVPLAPLAAVPLALPSVDLAAMESIALPGDRRKRRRRKSRAPLVTALSVLLLGAVGAGWWIMSQPGRENVALRIAPKIPAHTTTVDPTSNQNHGTSPTNPPPLEESPIAQPAASPATNSSEPPAEFKPEIVVIDPGTTAVKKPQENVPKNAAKSKPAETEPSKPKAAPPGGVRHEIPSTAAQTQARQLIDEVYQADFAQAKAAEAKPALAKKMLREAAKTSDDLAVRYMLLREAADLAADAGDVELATQSLETLSAQFDVDYLMEYSAELLRMSAKPHSLAVESQLVEAGRAQVDAALEAANFEAARGAAEAVEAAARRMKDTSLLKQVVELHKTIKAARQQWESQQAARGVLERSPGDPAANLLVGRYEAFVQGKWPQAFAHLAQGGPGLLSELAAKSLSPPQDPAALAELGDAWWKAGENAKEKDRADLRAAAAYWYQQALPGLTGLKKENVLNHLSDARDRTAVKGAILVFTFEPSCFFSSGGARYLLDLSGLGNHAEVKKAILVPGKVGSGLSFGTGNGYVECSKSDAFNDLAALSISAWIKPRSWKTSHVDYIVSKDDWADGGAHGFVFRGASDGDINFAFGNGDWRGTTSKRHLELDVWHHLASVYDGRRVTIFLDGVPDVSKETPFKISPSNFPLRIGRGGFTPDRFFDGVIDELAIFNRPLSDVEVRGLYRLGLQGKPLAK